ncbi:hypothetical protein CRE_12085 [Caenorhabditis remanei]|uniref:G-protein coupled receptors family 1 profile domain-containing protein n=1 Tax=Caenorhabditis remanei TaxID=31234 RepID=E3MPT8_CAERE|nr:hypothetical protein CRE_12085 [Caenorhabditis remanei]
MYVFSTTTLTPLSTTKRWHGRDPTDYYFYEGGPEEGWQYKEEYLFDDETEGKTMDVTNSVDLLMSVIGSVLNLIHLLILTRKEMRSNVVFIIMTGICVSDILVCSASITERYFGNSFGMRKICGTRKQWWMTFIEVLSAAIQKFGKLSAAVLALFMACIRTASVIFPMSRVVGTLMRVRTGLIIISGTFLLCIVWYLDYYKNFEIYKPEKDEEACYAFEDILNRGRLHIFLEGCVVILLTICYLLVTLTLLIALHMVRRKRKTLAAGKFDNTSFLVIMMAVSFFISELLYSTLFILGNRDDPISSPKLFQLGIMLEYVAKILLTFNSIFHCFICFFLSTQYRTVIQRMLCWEKKTTEMVEPVTQTHSEAGRTTKTHTRSSGYLYY